MLELLEPLVAIGKQIKKQADLVQANKKQSATLSKRVNIVLSTLQGLDALPAQDSINFTDALHALEHTLYECLDLVSSFSQEKWYQRLFKAGNTNEAFERLNAELLDHANLLNVGLSAANARKLIKTKSIHDPARDQKDAENDRKAIQENMDEILRLQQENLDAIQALQMGQEEQNRVREAQYQSMLHRMDQIVGNLPAQNDSLFIDRHLDVDFFQIAIDGFIAQGSFGAVYEGRYLEQPVAVKVLEGQLTAETQEEFIREVRIMARLRSPYIVEFYGACSEPQRSCILMEYLSGGSLDTALPYLHRRLSIEEQHQLLLKLARGLHYLHQSGVIHRDFKSANVLLDAQFSPKITDFGLSWVATQSIVNIAKTTQDLCYMPPEHRNRTAHYPTAAYDAYSFGVVMWEILRGCLAFDLAALRDIEGQSASNSDSNADSHSDTDSVSSSDSVNTDLNSTHGAKPVMTLEDHLANQAEEKKHLKALFSDTHATLILGCWSSKPSKRPEMLDMIRRLEVHIPSDDPRVRLPSPTPEFSYQEGIRLQSTGRMDEAFSAYERAANKNHIKATTNLGIFYLKGKGSVEEDSTRAAELFSFSAEKGHTRAQYNLGSMFYCGDGVDQDDGQAAHWLGLAADQGHEGAVKQLAKL